MNDLLSQTFSARKNGRGYDDLESGGGPSTQMADMGPGDQKMERFFAEVEKVKGDMDRIKQLLAKLQEANEESKGVHRAPAMKALRDRMDADIAQVSKLARAIKGKLEDLDRGNAESRRVKGCEEGTPTDRTRMTITNNQRKKLKDLMGEFQSLRERMMNEYKETIERRYYTVTGQQADEDTIEQIIETGQSETFLQKAIQEQGRVHVMETIREIQERHDSVKEIEKNLLELHQIFMDMAVLVEAQGEQLNNIEAQVNRSASYVERGTTHLRVAKSHQRSKRKWTCIAIILLIILLIIIIIPILRSNKVI
ncbi:hypothetical protein KC19_12G114000 [Ceratodon purpureus]|uniref:t-SNARE coiled-coil homology domain-containing protein n=1 Tax=Ceratodon purpureus TaxID=3225 RepID=A0A8T0G8Q7_CERPU|nr:hypothetical protein KC19_12G114000 [Ceratodon purpureus]